MSTTINTKEGDSRLGTSIATFSAKSLLVHAKHASVPREKLAHSMDLVSERDMERHKVFEASPRFALHEMGLGR
jgi:hypothetical protein